MFWPLTPSCLGGKASISTSKPHSQGIGHPSATPGVPQHPRGREANNPSISLVILVTWYPFWRSLAQFTMGWRMLMWDAWGRPQGCGRGLFLVGAGGDSTLGFMVGLICLMGTW